MKKALVVDDSRSVRIILSRMLKELGWEVVQASNGQEALDAMALQGPSVELALVDWNMPVMTGLEFVRQLRTEPLYRDVRLMMITTETEIEQVSLALDAGANEYMMKPFTREAVEDKLRLLGVIQ
jgi:two-component system chemotaxis response regulator CheY